MMKISTIQAETKVGANDTLNIDGKMAGQVSLPHSGQRTL